METEELESQVKFFRKCAIGWGIFALILVVVIVYLIFTASFVVIFLVFFGFVLPATYVAWAEYRNCRRKLAELTASKPSA